MKRILIILYVCFVQIGAIPVLAEEPEATVTFDPQTGDVEFDAILGDLNIQAEGNLAEFITGLSVTYKVPEEKIEKLITEEEMTPADAFMVVGVATTTKQPIDDVAEEYKANQGKGWGVIAKRLGIKPGSEEFHALKNGGTGELEKAKRKIKEKTEEQDQDATQTKTKQQDKSKKQEQKSSQGKKPKKK